MSKWLARLKHTPQEAVTDQVTKVPEATPAATPPGEASALACLMELPDGRQFWLAPDGMKFETGGIPILGRSVMDKLTASGADVKAEVMRLIDALHELGGELRIELESRGARPLPTHEKAHSGEMVTA